ncbi:HK97-gp10 family putative phage morphogenesis protein [Aquibium sp. LZ166]|uniref:HK97-gp10 family putative phage morphogenesis protein n=1 Tax=Aquibium pacificus TaxID=3153579 RepID=A0ABV3SJF4_9HYPH
MAPNNGLANFKRRLANIPKSVRRAAGAALEANAADLVRTQRALAPRDDGDLQASIRWSRDGEIAVVVEAGGETTTRQAKGGAYEYDYALAQEFGTKEQPGQSFFWPGYRLMRKKMNARTKRAISKSVKEAYASGK